MPWLTQGLLRSIQQKNELFSRSHKNSFSMNIKSIEIILNWAIERAKRNYYNEKGNIKQK